MAHSCHPLHYGSTHCYITLVDNTVTLIETFFCDFDNKHVASSAFISSILYVYSFLARMSWLLT